MKHRFYIYIAAILLTFPLQSCEHDFDLVLPRASKNVVLANFSPELPMKVYISSTVPVGTTDSASLKYPTDANVNLFADDEFKGTMVMQEGEFGELPFYTSDIKVRSGVEYQVEVDVKGNPISVASNVVPSGVTSLVGELISIEEIPDPIFIGDINITARIRLDIEDEARGDFYYHLKGISNEYSFVDISVVNNVDHLNILHEEGVLVRMPGHHVSRQIELEVKFYYNPIFHGKEPIRLEVRKCSEDYYQFHRSVGEQELSNFRDGILSTQTIQIHNNIENGVGNFSSYVNHRVNIDW